ncbi:heavy metal translocatin [Auricularia subglabra TFB-10046 SS5]|nr:heavy metal translocatin [Auricularia subglabra TFB-10046 SS5]
MKVDVPGIAFSPRLQSAADEIFEWEQMRSLPKRAKASSIRAMSAKDKAQPPLRTIDVNNVRYVVGECLTDGSGGCKRAQDAGISCCNPAVTPNISLAPCCAEPDEDEDEEEEEDDCCSNCDDKSEKDAQDMSSKAPSQAPEAAAPCAKACCDAPATKKDSPAESCCSDCGDDEDDHVAAVPDEGVPVHDQNAGAQPARGCCSGCNPEPVPAATVAPIKSSRVDLDVSEDDCCSDCGSEKDEKPASPNVGTVAQPTKTQGCCSGCSIEPVPAAAAPISSPTESEEDDCCSDCGGGGGDKDDTPIVKTEGIRTCATNMDAPARGGCCSNCAPELTPAARNNGSVVGSDLSADDCCSDCGGEEDKATSTPKDPVAPAPFSKMDQKPARGCCANCEPTGAVSEPILPSKATRVDPATATDDGDDCCSDCDDKPAAKQPVDDCCSNCDDGASIRSDEKSEKACCSDCSGDKDAATAAVIPVVPEATVTSALKGKSCCASQNVRRRNVPKKAGSVKRAATPARDCPAETAMGRFYEVACCCLVDWARASQLATRKRRDSSPIKNAGVKAPVVAPAPAKTSPRKAADPELGLGGGRRLTMAMSISGMDCPQCTTKITRALDTIASVHDAKVNFFTARATMAYTDGVTAPADIAKRTSELTGFTCAVLDEVLPDSEVSLLRIRLPAGVGRDWEKGTLPAGVTVKSSRADSEGTVLDVEYNSLVILPRAVVASFEEWGGTFVPTPKVHVGAQAARQLNILLLRSIISALLCIPVLIFSWAPLPEHPIAYGGASLALAIAIQVYIAAPLYSSALRSLFLQHMLDMDLLVVLSTSIAYIFSVVSYFLLVAGRAFAEPLFETSTLLVTLITLGRLISAYARRRATSALDELYNLQADTVEVVDAPSGAVRTISAELVHPGDVLHIAPGAVVPTDGVVASGTGHVDESSITGESMPVDKAPGSRLTAGTTNGESALRMRVDRLPADSTVAEIGALMLDVQNQRLPVQDLADRVAGWLAPVVLVVSVVTFAVWLAVGMKVRKQGATHAAVAALRYSVAVMAVSCPCALVLCVPMVVVIATAVASKAGILFKSAEAVQIARNVEVVVFDKTGTLTTGTLAVCKTFVADEQHVGVILGLVAGSSHPVSRAIFSHLTAQFPSVASAQLKNTTSLPGQGLEASHKAAIIRGGNPAWLGLEAHPEVQQLQQAALTVFAVTIGGMPVAAFGLADTPRPDARDTVDMLLKRGAAVYIVSGDSQPVVDALAATLAIPPARAFGGCLPKDKLEHVRALQHNGGTVAKTVMFVGDGTNDALALAQADVGVSFSAGTAVAASAAHVLLLNAHLHAAIKAMFALSHGAVRRVYINFVWAFLYNLLAVLGAAGALVRVRIAPEYAGLGEMVSVVPVVVVAWSMWLLKQ